MNVCVSVSALIHSGLLRHVCVCVYIYYFCIHSNVSLPGLATEALVTTATAQQNMAEVIGISSFFSLPVCEAEFVSCYWDGQRCSCESSWRPGDEPEHSSSSSSPFITPSFSSSVSLSALFFILLPFSFCCVL